MTANLCRHLDRLSCLRSSIQHHRDDGKSPHGSQTSRKQGRGIASSPPPAAFAVDWLDLPDELLLCVLDRLPRRRDLSEAAAVCRSWRAVASSHFSSTFVVDRPPLLLFPLFRPSDRRCDRNCPSHCLLFSPIGSSVHSHAMVSVWTLRKLFLGSAYGQLIFCGFAGYVIIIADIVTGVELRLPVDLVDPRKSSHATLTCPLTHPGSSLLLCSREFIFRLPVDGSSAGEVVQFGPCDFPILHTVQFGPCDFPILPTVAFKHEIFGLGRDGRLYAIDVSSRLSLKEVAAEGSADMLVPFTEQFLVECGGKLMLLRLVPTGDRDVNHKVAMYCLSLSGQPEWVKVDSLGDWAVFVDEVGKTTISCAHPGRWGGRSNCIYYPGTEEGKWRGFLPHETIDFVGRVRLLCPTWVYPSTFY